MRRPGRTAAIAVAAALTAAACAGEQDASTTRADVSATVAVGRLPEPLSGRRPPPVPPTSGGATTTSTTVVEQIDGPIGEHVSGSRVLLIGDSLLAATAPRSEGLMCPLLTEFGWDVEIDAEPGRFVEFGHEVLDSRLRPATGTDWDAVAVFLGNQYGGDLAEFTAQLDELLDRIAPRPTILYTLTELGAAQEDLNEVIRERERSRPNVVIVDWAAATAAEPDLLLVGDGFAITEDGAGRLALLTTAALGEAPGFGPGECLPSAFTDDSAIVL